MPTYTLPCDLDRTSAAVRSACTDHPLLPICTINWQVNRFFIQHRAEGTNFIFFIEDELGSRWPWNNLIQWDIPPLINFLVSGALSTTLVVFD